MKRHTEVGDAEAAAIQSDLRDDRSAARCHPENRAPAGLERVPQMFCATELDFGVPPVAMRVASSPEKMLILALEVLREESARLALAESGSEMAAHPLRATACRPAGEHRGDSSEGRKEAFGDDRGHGPAH
jgi:hypothetical protein